MGPLAQLRIVFVTSMTFLFYINVINDGVIYQPQRPGVHNETWFCSVEIGDIAQILTFNNGRNKDQHLSSARTNRFSASCHAWFCHDSEVKKIHKAICFISSFEKDFHNMSCDIFLRKVNIWNVNGARATLFIFDTRTGVLGKVSKFLRQKMSRPEGDWNPQSSDSCRML